MILHPKAILGFFAVASSCLLSGCTAFAPSSLLAKEIRPSGDAGGGAMTMELRAVVSVPPPAEAPAVQASPCSSSLPVPAIIKGKMNMFLARCEQEEINCARELEERKAAILNEFIEQEREDILQEVQELAKKKDQEIQKLKEELEDLVQQQQQKEEEEAAAVEAVEEEDTSEPMIIVPDPTVLALSKEELINKVKSFQAVVAKYMADAAQQQARAVQEAEDILTRKYEAQLKELGYVEDDVKEETLEEAATANEATETTTTETTETIETTTTTETETTPELVQSIMESAAAATTTNNLLLPRTPPSPPSLPPPPPHPQKQKPAFTTHRPSMISLQPDNFLKLR